MTVQLSTLFRIEAWKQSRSYVRVNNPFLVLSKENEKRFSSRNCINPLLATNDPD